MRLYDAYRMGYLTREQYIQELNNGGGQNSMYLPPNQNIIIPTPNYTHGVTTAVSTNVLESDADGSLKQSVSVSNNGGVNSLNAIIEFRVAGILSKTITETIAPLSTFFLETEYAVSQISVNVLDTVSGQHTSFEVGITVA